VKAIAGMKGNGEAEEFVRRTVVDTPLGRVGLPEDIADMVGFLVSDQARFVTGQHMIVDGGRSRAL
jgi:3-oxoacyl-[acyl-carrier protein] reductase